MSTNKPDLIINQVIEREGDAKDVWRKIGAGFANSKGGYKIVLDSVPMHGDIVAMPPKEDEAEAESTTA